MKIKKIVALLITLAMCVGLLTVPVMAEGDAWDGTTVDTSWYNETDTEFTLSTGAQLAGLAKLVNEGNTFNAPVGNDTNAKTIKLGDDIDLGGEEWTPIGTASHPFRGYFDGQNHTIKNLKINQPTMDYVGLFGYHDIGTVVIGNVATFGVVVWKDLTIENVDITGKQCVGALAGYYSGDICQNVTVKGSIKISGEKYIGGLVGYSHGDYKDITITGDSGSSITGGETVGGAVGFKGESGIVNTCLDNIKVSNVTVTGTRKIGGVAGSAYTDNYITNIEVNDVAVGTTATSDYANSKQTSMGVGGVVGIYNVNSKRNEYANSRDGKIDTVSVSNVTLTKPEGVTASLGYITGGETGTDSLPVKPTFESESAVADITVNGTNSGANNTYLYDAIAISDVEAYIDTANGEGNIRFITTVNSGDATDFGTYFVRDTTITDATTLTEDEHHIKLSGENLGSKKTFMADMINVPGEYNETPFYAISYVRAGGQVYWSASKGVTIADVAGNNN